MIHHKILSFANEDYQRSLRLVFQFIHNRGHGRIVFRMETIRKELEGQLDNHLITEAMDYLLQQELAHKFPATPDDMSLIFIEPAGMRIINRLAYNGEIGG